MRDHIKLLGILNIVWSSISIVIALIVLLVFGGLAGVLGIVGAGSPDNASSSLLVAPFLALIGFFIVALLCVVSLPALIGGIGLVKFQPWSRVLMIVVSVLHLVSFPFGTALGVYGLWVLLHDHARREFESSVGSPLPDRMRQENYRPGV
jgi:hypothetical protein